MSNKLTTKKKTSTHKASTVSKLTPIPISIKTSRPNPMPISSEDSQMSTSRHVSNFPLSKSTKMATRSA